MTVHHPQLIVEIVEAISSGDWDRVYELGIAFGRAAESDPEGWLVELTCALRARGVGVTLADAARVEVRLEIGDEVFLLGLDDGYPEAVEWAARTLTSLARRATGSLTEYADSDALRTRLWELLDRDPVGRPKPLPVHEAQCLREGEWSIRRGGVRCRITWA